MKIHKIDLRDYIDFTETEKIMSVTGERLLMFDAMTLGLLRRELIEMFGVFGARNVLTRFGYAHGYRIGETLRAQDPEALEVLCAGASHHLLYGATCTVDIDRKYLPNGNFIIKCELINSYEAEQHLLHFGIAEEAICWTITGFASGFESSRTGMETYCFETECVGKGDPHCIMLSKPKDEWDEATLAEQLPFYGISSANALLNEISDKLHKTQESLKQCRSKYDFNNDFFHGIIARSKKMQNIIDIAKRSSQVDSSVVVTGESGVGKEVISRFIHDDSSRSKKPFIAVNCGAFSDTLLESELFGHVKGSFTGANRDHMGLFEAANGGTLFLDEIGETSLPMQIKLLRVLQEKEIRRVGDNIPRKIDVRIIAATNKNLTQEVADGNFRKDLYYRLRVIEIDIPPLRDRPEDILPLAHVFLKASSKRMNKTVTGINSEAAKAIMGYEWPGNVRELQNAIERAVAFSDENWICKDNLPSELQNRAHIPTIASSIIPMQEMEKQYLLAALEVMNNDKQATADKLKIGLSTMYKKLKDYNIDL
ncbi:sigma 54-interacting transcriptional regulator [Seleniivibrio sp.]|uniref:sigma 54-interacting transcriptional regulator n=1 Tax=Seleniivibrio sp. TaxID=2898801 RepID=UPI0025FFABB3|nr:sigma 54-interacting transcriptional regulator [Seleniivibrio sp.]MCD8554818.1 sigma-54-dependent Fis family transcriptional regulator [Seleniivibrio sp.]